MRVMIVGHLDGHIGTAGKIALQRGAKLVHCEDIDQAMGALRNGRGADIALVDVKQDIRAFVVALENERIHLPIVACGVSNDAQAAVNAIKSGAREYLPLPPDSELIVAVLEAVTNDRNDMIGSDPAMQKVLKLADKIAPSDATVLITGESGTGKEVMARYIHEKSRRSDGHFIAVNCAAIPENLLESELFGHEKGAFTGAMARRVGRFEEANKGTLLLDEISEMHPLLQAKLLRAIQEREITRLGSNESVKIDVRILATSNRNLEASVNKGEFREDLYFRLNVVNIALPALRERPDDIIPLAKFFLDKYALSNGFEKKNLSPEAIQKIQNYHWRGNIRELENMMHRAILVSVEDEVEGDAINIMDTAFNNQSNHTPSAKNAPDPKGVSSHQKFEEDEEEDEDDIILPPKNFKTLQNPSAVEALIGCSVAEVERNLIINTLDHCLGNRTQAAQILGISIRTLRNKLNQYEG